MTEVIPRWSCDLSRLCSNKLFKASGRQSGYDVRYGHHVKPGQGAYNAAMHAADKVYECRELACRLFNFDKPEHVVFTLNATHALNIAIKTLVRRESRVVISGYEHNSVTRPLHEDGAKVSVAAGRLFDRNSALAAFEEKIPGADLVVCNHVSNVFGFIQPVYEISEICSRFGVPLIIDASQSAGIEELDAERLNADFIAMPGHKGLLGPQGTGILLCKAQPGTAYKRRNWLGKHHSEYAGISAGQSRGRNT